MLSTIKGNAASQTNRRSILNLNQSKSIMNQPNNERNQKPTQKKIPLRVPPIVEFKDLTNGEDPVVMIRLEDGSIYRLQKTKFGKLLLSK